VGPGETSSLGKVHPRKQGKKLGAPEKREEKKAVLNKNPKENIPSLFQKRGLLAGGERRPTEFGGGATIQKPLKQAENN